MPHSRGNTRIRFLNSVPLLAILLKHVVQTQVFFFQDAFVVRPGGIYKGGAFTTISSQNLNEDVDFTGADYIIFFTADYKEGQSTDR